METTHTMSGRPTTPYECIDLYVEAARSSNDTSVEYALSALTVVPMSTRVRMNIIDAHKKLRVTALSTINDIEYQINHSTLTHVQLDRLIVERDDAVFEYYMWDKLVRWMERM